jgi:hypothetical protein
MDIHTIETDHRLVDVVNHPHTTDIGVDLHHTHNTGMVNNIQFIDTGMPQRTLHNLSTYIHLLSLRLRLSPG